MKYLRKFNESLEPKYTYTDLMVGSGEIDFYIDVNLLLSLKNEIVGIDDDVLAVYDNFKIFRYNVEKVSNYGGLGFVSHFEEYPEVFYISEAKLVVKVETYDDFVSPELRIV